VFVLCVDLPAGQPVKLLVGFFNKGTNDFVVESMDAAFRYPQDYSFYIQNVCVTHRYIRHCLCLSAIVVLTVTDQLVFITIHHLITISVFTLTVGLSLQTYPSVSQPFLHVFLVPFQCLSWIFGPRLDFLGTFVVLVFSFFFYIRCFWSHMLD